MRREAQRRLRAFRRGSSLAVAVTGVALLLWSGAVATGQEPASVQEAAEEATGVVRDLGAQFYAFLPKLAIALALLALAWGLVRLTRPLMRRLLGTWTRADATTAMIGVGIWLLAIAAALGVILGDARAIAGSVGLFGLALSWALQTPIESFTGWLLNSFRGYYRVGDRIAVGGVFGDVYRIDLLTTTVWETGGPGSEIQGQSGALVTFPNHEVLRSNIVNYTLDFPYVWHETTFGITGDSDLEEAMRVIGDVAGEVVGEAMAEPAAAYEKLLARAGLDRAAPAEPRLFASSADAWTDVTVRYLVPARQRREWASRLLRAVTAELSRPEHEGRIRAAVPRMEVELTGEESGPGGRGGPGDPEGRPNGPVTPPSGGTGAPR